jgi:hypothetical protein
MSVCALVARVMPEAIVRLEGLFSELERMIRARVIQSVSSPSMRCPTTSNGLNVSGPRCPERVVSGRLRSNASIVAGVLRSTLIELVEIKCHDC